MQTVTSADGTRLAVWSSGEGPPLLLVHGASTDHTIWRLVAPELERRFTVHAMDRRGRGGSGDHVAYSLEREAEDVAAVVDAIGDSVDVLGHSYGGLCALEGATHTARLRRLILYESVPLHGAEAYGVGLIDRLDTMLQSGDVEGMLVTMMRELIERPPEEIELLRSQRDDWAARLRNAPTLLRELRSEERYTFSAARFGSMRAPTLLLVGGDSPPREMRNAEGVAEALADARIVVLPGQRHTAMYTAPALVVREVVRFLEG